MKEFPIKGYEGYYTISENGDVYNVKKCRYLTNVSTGRYLVVLLYKKGKRKMHYVHRLVAEAFCFKEEGKDHVNHKDHNKNNNTYTNLEWVTPKENSIHHVNSSYYKPRKVTDLEIHKKRMLLNKKVKCLITNKIYDSIKSFSKERGISVAQSSMKLNNVCKNNLDAKLLDKNSEED